MKAILMSIRPQWVAKILNGEKTIEIRKKFPKDYVGWVYIYATHNGGLLTDNGENHYYIVESQQCKKLVKKNGIVINGKVVARFWCDKVDEFYDFDDDLCESACLDRGQMLDYLGNKNGYAIHITNLEIFDKPKEISEFWNKRERMFVNGKMLYDHRFYLTNAPQSWCYIEV